MRPFRPKHPITLEKEDSGHGEEEQEGACSVPERVPLPAVPADAKRDGEEDDGEDEFRQKPPDRNRTTPGHGDADLSEKRQRRQEGGDPPEGLGECAQERHHRSSVELLVIKIHTTNEYMSVILNVLKPDSITAVPRKYRCASSVPRYPRNAGR